MVFNGCANGEMIETLKLIILQSKQVVNGVIKKATDTRGSRAGGFGFQIQDLADHASFPK
jgi:hypothetical protein